MNELTGIAKVAADFGGIGVLAVALFLLYRLADKFGSAFLRASQEQTVAMSQQASAVTQLVESVKEGQSDQREVLMAVRMQSDKIDRQGRYLEAIDDFMREKVKELTGADLAQEKALAVCAAARCGFTDAVAAGAKS